ncbi:SAM-dependent methyltransferase [Clostridium zeae]|uniref:SAM-dependent methyltransferase n=1 Tax=Clostridium zeae TaxID=2759022 RepID=A0ABQ1EEM9_9CLOT|nr:class I SAM-dependent methyltransferase [Clostridium zeae]GFZ33257.1 SAM-dependent methyltransferase [Clostridium zeae]
MADQLELVAKSYDKAIDLGRRGVDLYKELPEYITNDPNYPLFERMRKDVTFSDSGRREIIDYLSPAIDMNFIDLGCCLNLMFRGYDNWPSTYHGVDISSKTIQLLHEFAEKKKLSIGSLYCGSMHETPYDTNFFHIGACIGSLEYFEKDFVEKAIIETHRILKPYGKFVLDVPDIGSPEHRITMLIEGYLGRTDKFDMSSQEFEDILVNYFEIEKKEKVGPMIQYFLICKK